MVEGLDVANPTRVSGAGRKMFLTCPLIDQAITLKTPVTVSVCQLDAVWSQDFRLPAHVLVVPANVIAPNP